MIDPTAWKDALKPYELVIQHSFEGWTWTSGGCFAFASAFQEAYGGEYYGVCRVMDEPDDFPVDHALVKLDGVFYDYEGPFDILKLSANHILLPREADYVSWFEDDFFDDDAWNAIHEILKESADQMESPLKPR